MITFNPNFPGFEGSSRATGSKAAENQAASSVETKGEYDAKTGIVSFKQVPESITKILRETGILTKFNIGANESIGFKLEEGKPINTYSGILDQQYLAGIRSMPGLPAGTNVMSTFITRSGRDIYLASILILPGGRNGIVSNPVLNSMSDALYPLMLEADKVAYPIRAAALSLIKPSRTRDGIQFYKLDDLDPKYQPLIDYMHHFQKTSPKAAHDVYFATRDISADALPHEMRMSLDQEEPVRSGVVTITDQTQVTAISLSSSVDKPVAPVLLFTHTDPPIACVTEDFLSFVDGRPEITMPGILQLVHSLYNDCVKE